MIYIDYSMSNHKAIIKSESDIDEIKWAHIRRIIEDNSQMIDYIDNYTLSIPWWCFLNIRNELVKSLRIYKIKIFLSEKVKELLIKAQQHEKHFLNTDFSNIISQDEIREMLREKGFLRELTKQQFRNVYHLIRYPASATFSVPGAGKTTEALAYYYLKKNTSDKLLVVSPRNAFASWEEEIKYCIPIFTPSVVRLQGSEKIKGLLEQNYDIFLITYQQFYRVDAIISDFLQKNVCFMFLDESHRIKRGYSGVHGSSILSVCHLPKYKLIMSGTPLPNAIEDLIPQFIYLYPEIFFTPLNVVNYIQNLYVRTTKNELGLKPPVRQQWILDMNPAQRSLFDNIISETRRRIEGLSLNDRVLYQEIGKCIVRLIQVTTDPALLINTEIRNTSLLQDAVDEGPGVKIQEACHLARKLASEDEKSIIWTQFVNTVETVADMLSDLNAEYIHGGIETDEDEENYASRESVIKRFHDDASCMVLVANPAACAEGISLHKVCHNAIYIDRNYNAAHYLQSEDRIHRLGLKPEDDTFIHILTCRNSIDDSISKRLEFKISRMGEVLNDRQLSVEPIQIIDEISGLTFEDIEDIKKLIMGDT